MKVFLWLFLLAILIGPAYYVLFVSNGQIQPLAQVLLDVLIVMVSWILSREVAIASAKQQANAKWIPQSRQACRALLTVWAELQAFRHEMAQMCSTLTRELPEMQEEKMRGARAVLSGQCKNGASRIDAISNHLTDSVAAWETFITANCEGMECSTIQEELDDHRFRLEAQIARLQQSGQCPTNNAESAASGESPSEQVRERTHSRSPAGIPDVLFAHVANSSAAEGFTQILNRENDAWNGGNISVRNDTVVVDGAHYPLLSQRPIHAIFDHRGRKIEITE